MSYSYIEPLSYWSILNWVILTLSHYYLNQFLTRTVVMLTKFTLLHWNNLRIGQLFKWSILNIDGFLNSIILLLSFHWSKLSLNHSDCCKMYSSHRYNFRFKLKQLFSVQLFVIYFIILLLLLLIFCRYLILWQLFQMQPEKNRGNKRKLYSIYITAS